MPIHLTRNQASVAVLVAAALWGIYWIPIRHLTGQGVEGPLAVAMLNGPPAVAAGAWALATWRTQRPHLRRALAIGLVAGAGFATFSLSIAMTTVVRATLLFYLMPVWATFIGIAALGERVAWTRWCAIAAGLAGLGLLVAGDARMAPNAGDALAFLSGWFWAVAATLIRRGGAGPVSGMLAFQFLFTVALALGLGQALAPFAWTGVGAGAAASGLALSLAIVLPAVVLLFWASQFLPPGRVGLLLMVEVAVAVGTASLLLPEETLRSLQWGAVALIAAAAVIEVLPAPGGRPGRARRG